MPATYAALARMGLPNARQSTPLLTARMALMAAFGRDCPLSYHRSGQGEIAKAKGG